jgi:glycosyltransferase involved in cell wall biosynthesis
MMDKPRILMTINASWNIYNFRMPLIRALQGQGYEVITVAPEDAYSDYLREETQYYPLAMHNSGTSPLRDCLLFIRYVRLFKRLKPDAVLAYTIKPNIYASLACGVLRIPIINNVSGLGTVFIRRNWVTHLVERLYRSAFQCSLHIFFQNAEDYRFFVDNDLVEGRKTEVIPGSGVDLEFFQPCSKPRKHAFSFLLVARMLWDKGIGEYAEAARIVKKRFPEVEFHLLGPHGIANRTAIAPEQIHLWAEEGLIHYDGESDDVPEAIARSNAVVLPSYREGMSRALLEGLAMGKPLIATDVPGCREMVEVGRNGYLCRLKDAEDLAKQLVKFIELPSHKRSEMGKVSREKAVKLFDQKIVIDAYLKAIKAAISVDEPQSHDQPEHYK